MEGGAPEGYFVPRIFEQLGIRAPAEAKETSIAEQE